MDFNKGPICCLMLMLPAIVILIFKFVNIKCKSQVITLKYPLCSQTTKNETFVHPAVPKLLNSQPKCCCNNSQEHLTSREFFLSCNHKKMCRCIQAILDKHTNITLIQYKKTHRKILLYYLQMLEHLLNYSPRVIFL